VTGVGLIGCGVIGKVHALGIAQLAREGEVGVRPVVAADPSEERRREMGGVCEFPRLAADPLAVVGDPEVDAVVIASPTHTHRELVGAAMEAGKSFFCEKPLAPRFEAVRDMCRLVSTAGVAAQVGFHSRFHPLLAHLKGIVESGELGAPMGYTLRDDQYFPTTAVQPAVSDWRSKQELAGGGALLEHSIHSLDLLAWLFGTPARVYASLRNVFGYQVEDTAALTLEHQGGVVGNLVTIFNGVTGREERRLEVFFERGAVEVTTDFLVGAKEESFLVQRPDAAPERLDPGRLLAEHLEGLGIPSRSFAFFQYLADRAFFLALREGTPPAPGFADALVAHAAVEAAYRSARKGAPVRLAPELLA
jgi:myo-inositol 2-dehydrogenase/D-chiro-inositol 1-dehydrogenase